MSVNKAILIGRLGKDPELKYTSTGKAVTTFSLATNEKRKDKDGNRQDKTTWHNIVAWGKQAEVMKEYLTKGKEVYIEGRIDNRSYEDKENVKKYVSEIVVQSFQFVGSMKTEQTPESSNAGDSNNDDDLPF
jgi:single-strand DNA-binding protein